MESLLNKYNINNKKRFNKKNTFMIVFVVHGHIC